MTLQIFRTKAALRTQVKSWKAEGLTIGLVPTMGALHAGHLSLVDQVAQHADRVITTIFINPTQFGEGEDFSAYPRTEADDVTALENHPCHAVYIPTPDQLYPDGFASHIHAGQITARYEGAHRPGHFDGVATVVTKLIMQSLADIAIFGEKDFQQLAVIRRTASDLDLPVQILAGAIKREADGLAMSSRNRYLSAEERQIAGQFNLVLKKLVEDTQTGTPYRQAEETAKATLKEAGFSQVDYVDIVDPISLDPAQDTLHNAHVISVARIGKVRLLDNMPITRK